MDFHVQLVLAAHILHSSTPPKSQTSLFEFLLQFSKIFLHVFIRGQTGSSSSEAELNISNITM